MRKAKYELSQDGKGSRGDVVQPQLPISIGPKPGCNGAHA